MSAGRTWTTLEVKQLHDMRARRMTTAEIGMVLDRSQDAIYSFLRYVPAGNGVPATIRPIDRLPPRPPKPRRDSDWKPEEIARIRELAEDGASIKDASDALKRSQSAVRCKASHLEIRFANKGRHSIYRLEQEENHFRQNAVEGSAKLLTAMLTLAA